MGAHSATLETPPFMPLDALIAAHAGEFSVDAETGHLFRDGVAAGHLAARGYVRVFIKRRGVFAHRVAWFLYYGQTPPGAIDHINGNRADNRRCNLRIASGHENNRNRKKRRVASSVFKGVNKDWNRWRARIRFGDQRIELGSFASEREAAVAYDNAARAEFGRFAALNFPLPGEASAFKTFSRDPSASETLPVSERQTARGGALTLSHGAPVRFSEPQTYTRALQTDAVIAAEAHNFSIDPDTGEISRLGKPVRYVLAKGYLRLCIKNRGVQAHRLAWYLYYGDAAAGEVDHVNGDKTDNRKANLRVANAFENGRNRAKSPGGSSVFKGVNREWRKWRARIWVGDRSVTLGRFPDERSAAEAYDEAARALYGQFATLNFPNENEQSAHRPFYPEGQTKPVCAVAPACFSLVPHSIATTREAQAQS